MIATFGAMRKDAPIFLRGMSRSGGTLLVTILDAHPDVAMSYELYPNLLDVEHGDVESLRDLAARIGSLRRREQATRCMPTKGLSTFFARCLRSGIGHQRFGVLLCEHADAGFSFSTVEGRMRFIERCCLAKMQAEGKSRWGLKCNNRYEDYLDVWPDGYFLNMLRDGQDVLTSQLNTGSFKKSPAQVAEGWVSTHRRFRELIANPDVRAYEVRYESLVADPHAELKQITDFLNLRFEPSMLEFYRKELTIYSASHLSMDRISHAVDATSVGRWRRELPQGQLAEFRARAGPALAEFGYAD